MCTGLIFRGRGKKIFSSLGVRKKSFRGRGGIGESVKSSKIFQNFRIFSDFFGFFLKISAVAICAGGGGPPAHRAMGKL